MCAILEIGIVIIYSRDMFRLLERTLNHIEYSDKILN